MFVDLVGMLVSNITLEVASPIVLPYWTAEPGIAGTPTEGTVSTVTDGTIGGTATITVTYQWFLNGVAVDGQEASTYTPVGSDIGKYLSARVYASNAAGTVWRPAFAGVVIEGAFGDPYTATYEVTY